MKKISLLVLSFITVTIIVCMMDESFLSVSKKIIILIVESVIFEVSLMDRSFLKKERRAALKKVIDDYPSEFTPK